MKSRSVVHHPLYSGEQFSTVETEIENLRRLISVLAADVTGTDVNTAQPVFGTAADALTVAATTTYRFAAQYWITRAAGTTSHTTAVLFGGTATFTSIGYSARSTSSTGAALTAVNALPIAVATASVITAASTSATENLLIQLEGVMRIAAGGTLIPQFQYSAAPGGAPTIKANSFFECWPIGTNTVATVGSWG